MKHEITDLGKRVRVWQVMNGISTNTLCQMVREQTHMASPRSYIWSVLVGLRKSDTITEALEEIIAEKEFRVVSSERCEIPGTNEEAYLEWKAELAKRGKLPKDTVLQYKALGMTQYAEKLETVIQEMEGVFEAPI